MDEYYRKKIEFCLSAIMVAADELKLLLPEEQSHVGSELFKIDRAVVTLKEKYVDEQKG